MMVSVQKGEPDMVWTIMQKKSKNASIPTQQANMTDAYQSPSPTWAAQSDAYQFHFDEDINERNLDSSTPLQHIHLSTPVQHIQALPAQHHGGFHEKYLKLKK
jgi:hypothetical protein